MDIKKAGTYRAVSHVVGGDDSGVLGAVVVSGNGANKGRDGSNDLDGTHFDL